MDTTDSPWWGFGTLVAALLVTVAACGQAAGPDPAPGAGGTQTSAPASGAAEPEQVEVVAVHEDVDYYIGCADAPLRHEGLEFWPLLPEEREDLDLVRYGTGMGVHIVAVAEPGPGDDIGTLTVYADGRAHYVSHSGQEIWLVDEPREYNWVC
ncbi:MAG: DUF3597 domain-containing protein [Actinomycetales bacterium]|nr:DUF3597 domain-containing protein [Actinomycetales bacterium]